MADYFNEYSAFAGNRLPSPADTPYETPAYLRSKRSSRVGSSREQSTTPPPLPSDSNDTQDKSRDGHFSAVDPRRFTPTLHASLVSEILNLRREIDSKNNLVENLETALSQTRDDNDSLAGKLSESTKEIRKAKHQVQQMEKGTLDAVEDLAKERDAAKSAFHEIRSKFEVTQKKTRVQDDDAVRAQSIWESEKESWDNERRQLERRVHVTESRLRAVLDEMASQQNQAMQSDEAGDESAFKDSGLGDGEGSDTASLRSAAPASPAKHKRNMSSISFRPRNVRTSVSSRGTAATPDLYGRSGNTLADELGIDEEDEYDDDEYENGEMDLDGLVGVQRVVESRQSLRRDGPDAKANGVNGRADHASDSTFMMDAPDGVPNLHSSRVTADQDNDRSSTPTALEAPSPVSQVKYVDTGYQPSPPPSPPRVVVAHHDDDKASALDVVASDRVRSAEIDHSVELPLPASGLQTRVAASPISPPQTPVVDDGTWPAEKRAPEVAPLYHTASTQTELVEQQTQQGHTPKQDSLSPPQFVPSIAIHPPSSRPSSPRPYALPPGTKNAASQANINRSYKDAGMQTAEIRVDKRPVKLAAHLLPSHLLPSPPLSETASRPKRVVPADSQKTLTKSTAAITTSASVPFQLPVDPGTEMLRSSKDLRSYPLKAIPLPRPVLSPLASPSLPQPETHNSNGPLNRSTQYGVSQPRLDSQPLADDVDPWSAHSDYDGHMNDFEADFASSIPGLSRPPPGRFGLSEPPKAVPEDKEISPERRPGTAGSHGHAPGPSVSSSRPSSQSRHLRQSSKSGKSDTRRDPRSRSPSFGSMASSSQSAPTGAPMPPFPIPLRRSSRTVTKPYSDGSQSPTSYEFSTSRGSRSAPGHARQVSLRKVQSAAIIRTRTGRVSPKKGHRQRRRTPDLTPVQSMAFEDPPMPTDFPIPELPTPLQDSLKYVQGSVDMSASAVSAPRASEETNLVDAIAGTMVGEWMWKYIRKRKSFGIGDDTDLPVADQNGFMNSTGHGTRHKRWVWLSPYERTIMWDSKQPTSGPALLGKKGRKLSIQSVLDVPDLTALPRNPELGAAWNRSILILTPERALKFTATTQERHRLWMAALAFLAQSQSQAQTPQDLNSFPRTVKAPPPVPTTSFDGVPIKRHRAPSFGKSTVRDSIRLAKGKKHESSKYADVNYESGREEGADFPSVPRLYITTSRHQRKRSYTNPGVQASSDKFRSLTSSAVQSSHGGSTNGSSYRPSASSKSGSRRDSIASPDRPNFFEAVGTVRMEAFVDPNVRDGVLYVPAPPPTIGGAPRRRRHERDLSQSTVDKRRAGYVFDGDDDPFHGF